MFSSPAFAQTAGSPAGASGLAAYSGFIPIVLMVGIFYFLLIRPQQQRAKQHRMMIDAVKKGDVVVTGGGMIGRATKIDGDEVEVELAPNVRVRAVKSTLTEVRTTSKPAND
ncbi:preprotein translocase subunit YajC [uncultured Sphingomonas sp.]|jgi:preprotein translocase subunit YajC|uniref:preprotein translocase subunit YajC n=1 Tax=uncultured Sphingomonas sp. TaxID=158754 RepID=UPI002636C914|nr:preprotein translocase subunit YajC [uncultured Sphingomonas sp.]